MDEGTKPSAAAPVDDRTIYLVIRRAILSVLHIFDKRYNVSSLDK